MARRPEGVLALGAGRKDRAREVRFALARDDPFDTHRRRAGRARTDLWSANVRPAGSMGMRACRAADARC